MSAFVATDYVITLDGTDISDHITSVNLDTSVSAEDVTTFGSEGWTEQTAGMKSGDASIEVLSDYAELDEMLWNLLGETVTLTVRPRGAAVSPANPEYSASVIVTSHSVGAGVGSLATGSVSLPVTGKVTRRTS